MTLIVGWNDGHTLVGNGTGAVGLVKETDRNRAIGTRARAILQNEYEGVRVVNCTIDRSNNDLGDAVAIANANNCNVFISNHVNAGGGVGFETFYSRYASSDDIKKAKIIHDKLVSTKSCLANRRFCDDYSYKGYDLYVLRNTHMTALLCEIGFVDNAQCVNAVNVEEVAGAYVEGIASAYGLKKKGGQVPPVPPIKKGVEYHGHIEDIGWTDAVADGVQLGTTGEGKRLESIGIMYHGEGDIKFQGHIQYRGWTATRENGEIIGTSGMSLRLEAIKIWLENAPNKSVSYQVHIQNKGWTDWFKNGQVAGTTGESLRIEAIRIKIA